MDTVTLNTIAGGAAAELFGAELARVLANIADPNTDARQARKITIEITLAPNDERDQIATRVKCHSKLAGIKTVSTQLYVGWSGGKLVAIEHDPRQSGLFDDDQARRQALVDNMTPFTKRG